MGDDATSLGPVEKLARTYLTKVIPCYSALQKGLSEEGRKNISVLFNWTRDVFGAIKDYGALKRENAELRGELQRLTQEKHELEEAVSIALRLDENK